MDYLERKEIKGTKAKLDQWVTKVIKERWVCKERLENLVTLVCLEKLEKEGQLVFQERGVYQVIKEFVEIKEIRAKGVNKEREVYRANRVSAVIAVNRARRGLLERKEFQEIRVPEEIKASVEIKARMEILDQLVSLVCKEKQVKKVCQVIEENRVTKDQEGIEVIKNIIFL